MADDEEWHTHVVHIDSAVTRCGRNGDDAPGYQFWTNKQQGGDHTNQAENRAVGSQGAINWAVVEPMLLNDLDIWDQLPDGSRARGGRYRLDSLHVIWPGLASRADTSKLIQISMENLIEDDRGRGLYGNGGTGLSVAAPTTMALYSSGHCAD